MNEKIKFQRNVRRKLKLLTIFCSLSVALIAQTRTITGVVTAIENGETLIGVSIMIKGTSTGTVTDVNGKYSISISNKDAILVFSMIGMKKEELNPVDNSTFNVKMSSNSQAMDEVVVVGYGTQRKAELTSAISSVKKEDIKVASVATISEALQGKSPGVEVINNSNSPGGDISVRVRGV